MNGYYSASAVASPRLNFPTILLGAPLETLHGATLSLHNATSLQGVLQAGVEGALALSGAASGSISFSRNGATSPDTLAEALAEATAEVAQTSHLHDLARADERAWPMFWHGRQVGLVRVRANGHGLTPDCERAMELFCEAIASALESARRFETLQHAKREWELIFDGMVDGVYIARADGTVLRANRSFADALGMRLAEILGRRREEVHAHLPHYAPTRDWTPADNAPPELELSTCEYRFGAPERSFVETRFTLLPGETASSRRAPQRRVSIVRDVTESRRLQEQLLQSEKLAALGELVSGVAHELNNPLTTVVGYGQLLESDTALPPRARRQVGMIHQEAQRASHIVQNLLAFAHRSVPQQTRVAVNDVLASLVKMRAYQLAGDNVRITTDFCDALPPVLADSMQLQQVFLNIVNNAAHAVLARFPQGGGQVRIETERLGQGESERVLIAFSDNGTGMTPESLRRVFDPFFTTKGVGQGTGLGMSISLGIISSHNGRIWAESRPDFGTSFFIELPAATRDGHVPVVPAIIPATNLPAKASNGIMNSPESVLQSHILVIDDEEPVVTLISEIMILDGHRVTPAFNGAEALAILQTDKFDLIISDVRMPAVGGPTFFEILQTTRPDLLPRVIFVTGDTVSRSTQEFLSRAKRPVLAKPFDPERLRALVAEILAQN